MIKTYTGSSFVPGVVKMTGPLKKPDINLDIALNDLDKGALNGSVTERLSELEQDKSELNKQVFALLVLNRFIEENPLANQAFSITDLCIFKCK